MLVINELTKPEAFTKELWVTGPLLGILMETREEKKEVTLSLGRLHSRTRTAMEEDGHTQLPG